MERKFHVSSDRIYDEFEPMARWSTEPGFENLTVYLPGFKKEQLKVQVTSTRKLRVMGERPAGGNKWIRFRKEFPVQPNVDVDAISAKFEGVNLVLRLPISEPKGKQQPSSGHGAAKPPVHQADPKPPLQQQLPKATAGKEAENVQERSRPPVEGTGRKEEASVQVPKPAMEEPSENGSEAEKRVGKKEVSREVEGEKIKENDQKPYGGGYEQMLRGYVSEMKSKTREISVGLAVAASMVVFSLGIYAGKSLWCSFEG